MKVLAVVLSLISFGLSDDCMDQLINEKTTITASSSLPGRGPENARFKGLAWQAATYNYYQYISFDLGGRYNITAIATQGRDKSSEFVSEYYVLWSDDGNTWITYQTGHGEDQMFKGNSDGDTIHRNRFDTSIIAQYIRINPTRWNDRIAMRIELYGCPYVADVLHFNGTSMLSRRLELDPISSRRDSIQLRFRTNQPDGVLLYSRGSQGDILALQLVNNRMLLNINLGAGLFTSLSVGSLLDDNLWHDVRIIRNRREVVFSVDRISSRENIKGDYAQLDLNNVLFIGGVPSAQEGLVVSQNFTGCIENLFLNFTNVIQAVKDQQHEDHNKYQKVQTLDSCPQEATVPITFLTSISYAKLPGYEGLSTLNISLDFRSFEENGLLAYHRFISSGYVKLYLETGKIKVEMEMENVSKLVFDNFGTDILNDGRWHKIIMKLGTNAMVLSVDGRSMKTVRLMSFRTGTQFLIGGGVPNTAGFIGCMRHINVDGHYKSPLNWRDDEYCCKGEMLFDACQIIDRCNPNPCEHDGVCKQTSEEFYCDCAGTGYTGAVCHTSANPVSCESYRESGATTSSTEISIDVDGSGPLKAFPVTCEFLRDGRTHTYVGHKNDQPTVVNGFDAPGSFVQEIAYNAEMEQIEILMNRSYNCRQHLRYDCRRSRLLNSPSSNSKDFRPFSWWLSRQNQRMDYWAGALPGSRKCECGIDGTCIDNSKWCNCDAGLDTWTADEGEIQDKDYLPVRALRFGDTGTPLDEKEGKYTLGPLKCEGSVIFDNVVTFRLADATIDFPTFDMGHSGDVTFEFKSTVKNAVLIHSRGPSDYIKVSLSGGDTLHFEYSAGAGPRTVTVETAKKLSDNQWHSVSLERNRKEARMTVDGAFKSVIREPSSPVRAMQLTSPLVVGATVDYRDGFVGCMRGLMVNGQHLDMRAAALGGLYGIGVGCTGKCDSNPCQNNGTCLEHYDSYICDCRFTSFKGPICADEIGVNMLSNYMIKYDFAGSYKSTLAEKIRVGFATTDPRGILMGLFSEISNEYLILQLSNSGHLRLVFDFGFERREIIFEDQNFATGQFHDVHIRREDSGTRVVMEVDNYEPRSFTFKINPSADAQFNNIQYLFIGRNSSMAEGFVGCISRVEFDDIYPLKWLFQQSPPSNIMKHPETMSEDFCGIEPVTNPPDIRETRPPPTVSADELQKFYPPGHSAILGSILGFIFIILVCMAIVIGRYMSRHKGDYVTQEDKGAEHASDEHAAVMQSTTGHQVQQKKEIFI